MNANQEIIAELRRVLEERDQARRERDDALARIDSQRSQIAFYRTACTARFLPEGFGDETIRELIKELAEERDEARAQVDELRGQHQYSIGLSMALEEREKAIRERDLALGRLENEIKAANQARMAEERARESLDELDAAIYECLPSDYDDDSPLDCVEHAADQLRELARERDRVRAEVERLRSVLSATSQELADIAATPAEERALALEMELAVARAERDEARAERDAAIARITEVGVMVATNGNLLAKDAYRRGAEAMREACAAALMAYGLVLSRERAANVVRALPIPEEP